MLVIVTIAAVASARTPAPPAGFEPGARVLLDAHNAYPEYGKFADRIERALGTGLPVAIEQDLWWFVDPRSGVGRSVVSHGGEDAAIAPGFEDYFFSRIAPIMLRALEENRRDDWPLITLNLDFKTNEPEHHAAVWALLGKYEAWLTTAERTATPGTLAPLQPGPMLVLTGSNDAQQATFHDRVAAGQRLRLFGAVPQPPVPGANRAEQAKNVMAMAPATLIGAGSNYRRWVNFPWGVVEAGGQNAAADWTPADAGRLRALVSRAHAMNLWIRFYTLNGHTDAGQGWTASYNFGSLERAEERWRAAAAAGVDFIATDQYEQYAALAGGKPGNRKEP
jgi:hypothetical protein